MKNYMGNSCVPSVASGKAESRVIICLNPPHYRFRFVLLLSSGEGMIHTSENFSFVGPM